MKTSNSNMLSNRHSLAVTSSRNKIGLLTLIALLLCSFATLASAQETFVPAPEPVSGVAAASPRTTPIASALAPMQLGEADGADVPGSSLNAYWAGYAVTGTDFTTVLGSWVVPPYHCIKTPNAHSFFLVGFDGYRSTSTTYEAIGTASNCVGTNRKYYGWYQFQNQGGVVSGEIPSFTVKVGDLISAEITYANSEFTATISNITEGLFYEISVKVPGAQRSSAEWIVSKAELQGAQLPLMDFGKVSSGTDYTNIFETDWATDSSITGPIGDFSGNVHSLTMVGSGNVTEATPTALTTDGSSFSVSWKAE